MFAGGIEKNEPIIRVDKPIHNNAIRHSHANELDRSHLVGNAIDRVPSLRPRAAYTKHYLRDKLLDQKAYIHKQGEELPEIRNWQWSLAKAETP